MAKEPKIQELFAFNLLPPKSKDQLKQDARKATTVFYTTAMPIFCVILVILLFLLNAILVQPTVNAWTNADNALKAQLNDQNSALGQLKIRNGELKTKTDFIGDPVKKSVDFAQIFSFADKIFNSNPTGSKATSYGREDTGVFVINAFSPQIDGPAQILRAIKQDPEVQNVGLRIVQKDDASNSYHFTISFYFIVVQKNGATRTS